MSVKSQELRNTVAYHLARYLVARGAELQGSPADTSSYIGLYGEGNKKIIYILGAESCTALTHARVESIARCYLFVNDLKDNGTLEEFVAAIKDILNHAIAEENAHSITHKKYYQLSTRNGTFFQPKSRAIAALRQCLAAVSEIEEPEISSKFGCLSMWCKA